MHIVNRLILDLKCKEEEVALNVRQNFSALYFNEISQVIDEVCSKYDTGHGLLKIDSLEFDLGKFTSHAFDQHLIALFRLHLDKAIRNQIEVKGEIGIANQLSVSELELLTHFLITGNVPWWSNAINFDLNELLIRHLTSEKRELQLLLNDAKSNKHIWQRIIYQFRSDSKSAIIASIEKFDTLLKEVQSRLNTTANKISNSEISIQPTIIHDVILACAPIILSSDLEVALRYVLEKYIFIIIPQQEIAQKFAVALNLNVTEANTTGLSESHILNDIIRNRFFIEDGKKSLPYSSENPTETISKIKTNQAGLILLAPFFKQLFTNLYYWADADWRSVNAQHKAVHMLMYLSHGSFNCPEYYHTFGKILCNVPPEAPIALDVHFDDHELAMADSLLQSVREHWTAIGTMSNDGLRGSFLIREGILTQNEKGWLLQVERKPYDILLEKLPWGYTLTRLPWNNYMITTEWE